MHIEQFKQKVTLAQAKLDFCERLAAWPWLATESALKANGWARGIRIVAIRYMRALADERRGLGAEVLISW